VRHPDSTADIFDVRDTLHIVLRSWEKHRLSERIRRQPLYEAVHQCRSATACADSLDGGPVIADGLGFIEEVGLSLSRSRRSHRDPAIVCFVFEGCDDQAGNSSGGGDDGVDL
jgi:hypothetical protein